MTPPIVNGLNRFGAYAWRRFGLDETTGGVTLVWQPMSRPPFTSLRNGQSERLRNDRLGLSSAEGRRKRQVVGTHR